MQAGSGLALGMVEGTFINLREAKPGSNSRQRLVVIRDPSVRDYFVGPSRGG